MLTDPYDRRGRAAVLVVALLMPVLLAGPLVAVLWRTQPDAGTVVIRVVWLVVPVTWTVRILRLVARRERDGHPVDEQTRLLYHLAMMVPVIGYLPMLVWR